MISNLTSTLPKILLVTDSNTGQMFVEEALSLLEVELVIAPTAQVLEQCLIEYDFALVIIKLPFVDTDGLVIAKQIYESPKTQTLPLLLLAKDFPDEMIALMNDDRGVIEFLSEPFNPLALRHKINWLIKLERQRAKSVLLAGRKLVSSADTEQSVAPIFGDGANNTASLDVLIASSPDAIVVVNARQEILGFNRAAESLFGYTEVEAINQPVTLIMPKRFHQAHDSGFSTYLQSSQGRFVGRRANVVGLNKAGKEFPIELSLCSAGSTENLTLMAIIRDRSEHEAYLQLKELTLQVFNTTQDGVLITDKDCNIVAVNPMFEKISGYSEQELLGKNPKVFASGRHNNKFYERLWQDLLGSGMWSGDIFDRRKSGEIYPARMTISVLNDQNIISGYVSVSSDLSDIQQVKEQNKFLANHDSLTRLPGRLLFSMMVQKILDQADSDENNLAMLLINIELLQQINSNVGFENGDKILQQISERLQTEIKPIDCIARLGGNQFGMLLPYDTKQDLIALTQRLLDLVAAPYVIEKNSLSIDSCIGVSLFPEDGLSSSMLLTSAINALESAKQKGLSSYCFCTEEMNQKQSRYQLMTELLMHALERNELVLYYQPKASLITGRISGMEALIRWDCAELGGIVSPAEFIPIAEKTGLIVPIGEWVIRTACRQNKLWQKNLATKIPVAVNVSPCQFGRETLPAIIEKALVETGLDVRYLEIEITESVLMQDIKSAEKQISAVKKMRVLISLDDFGTGYSSLSFLNRFSLDKLKIDQSFVSEITNSPKSSAIARSTIALAQDIGMSVVAEGIETESQLGFLKKANCDEIQGYLYSRPLTVDDMTAFIESNKELLVDGKSVVKERRLLIVDDDSNMLKLLGITLKSSEYSVLLADSAQKALELLEQFPVQVILSDNRMPDMSGIELMSRVSQMYPETVRMILTAYSDFDSISDAINKGAVSKYMTKPWDSYDIRKTIKEAFKLFEKQYQFKMNDTEKKTMSIHRETQDKRDQTELNLRVSNAKYCVLIVDDDALVLKSLYRSMRKAGCEIVTADSAFKAFDILAQKEIHVIISDQRMPDMSGNEFLQRVSKIYPQTVRLILSGYTDPETLRKSINFGVVDKLILKPWDDADLCQILQEGFTLHEKRKAQ